MDKVNDAYAGAYYEAKRVAEQREQLQNQMASPSDLNAVALREQQAVEVATKYFQAREAFQSANIRTANDVQNNPQAQMAFNNALETHAAYIQTYSSLPAQPTVAQAAQMENERGGAGQAQNSGYSQQSSAPTQGNQAQNRRRAARR
ncbi:hypothetical protein [Streptomyces sp. NPDC050560]|uniref:hypothetical protein n=1 Tax=Streptomyces sp. NPDC050560 TaxID=3365630 RepID=UPI0037AF77A5